MSLVEKLELKIEQTIRITELIAVTKEVERKFSTGELTPQEYNYLTSIKQKRFKINISNRELLPNFLNDETNFAVASTKLDSCEIVAEEFEAIEQGLSNTMLEIIKNSI